MSDSNTIPASPRDFAVKVTSELRAAGYEALWAGGCVRDDLLGVAPKDYDVATTATPEQVIALFGKRRTVPVGVSFGVVMVLGPNKACGQIEVATFRADGAYLDGRRPDSVHFCSAEEDAKRRDFTINGMFFDPVAHKVIDYVGGQEDLQAGVVRAIGSAIDRFTEDKLRMLRAVRFAATYEFEMDTATADAIASLKSEITQVSAERIAQELRRMFAHSTRAVALQRLIEVGLHTTVLPLVFHSETQPAAKNDFAVLSRILSRLRQPTFEPTFSVLFSSLVISGAENPGDHMVAVQQQCRALKLSNEETAAIRWILDAADACRPADQQPLHVLKPILADMRSPLLLDFLRALALGTNDIPRDADFLQDYAARTPAEVLNPQPLITGADITALGVKPGPQFKQLLNTIRNEQLDERLADRDAALIRLKDLINVP